MENCTAFDSHRSDYRGFGKVIPDCISSTLFSHNFEDPTPVDLDSSGCFVADLQQSEPLRKQRRRIADAHQDSSFASDQLPFIRDIIPPTFTNLEQSLPPPRPCDSLPMDGSTSSGRAAPGLLPQLLPPSQGAFFRMQPPSPPLDTPELVQRSLPALRDPVSSPPRLSMSTQDLPEAFDVEMRDVEDGHFARPSTSVLCQRSGPTEDDFSPNRLCHWPTEEAGRDISSSPRSLRSTSTTSQLELLTPVSPSAPWFAPPSSLLLEDSMDALDGFPYESNLSDWNEGSSTSRDTFPSVSKRRSRSLELPETNDFDASSSAGSSFSQPVRAYTSPPRFISAFAEDLDTLWTMNVDDATAPHSPRPPSATLPNVCFETSGYLQDPLPLEVDPPPSPGASTPLQRDSLSLPELFDGDLYIAPNSPRAFTTRLPDLEMEGSPMEAPSSPRSPYRELSPTEDDPFMEEPTISPSLLVTELSEGLGLFISPASIDPPSSSLSFPGRR
ncbi:hypothetical protein NM688_g7298 [Phlebia brevispora]|uniref:Uncharacterized protein n=1 Tax=Phlebia brevispora TaxID=194682 RepID=A0ACC1S6Z1_9APHY|nr:hypothetical protein NM688_g7298 [Phlebia brevispora]